MSDASPILGLPLLQPSQAQKHVTHNEALQLLDALVQLAVADRTRTAPPTDPATGDRHIVAEGATGAWAGRDGQVAVREEGAWAFLVPRPGWVARVLDEGEPVVWTGSAWIAPSEQTQRFPALGVNATADAVNRLAVAAAATLLSHAGAGHQLKLNKAAAADTASLLFQTGFSGRAEMGTAGSDDWSVKVSPDGATWHTALSLDRATGRARVHERLRLADGSAALPALAFSDDADTGLWRIGADVLGLAAGGAERVRVTTAGMQVTGLVTGSAVTSSGHDTTAGRLTKVGDFGIGGRGFALPSNDFLSGPATGVYRAVANATANVPPPEAASSRFFTALAMWGSNTEERRTFLYAYPYDDHKLDDVYLGGTNGANSAIRWTRIFTQGSILGTVSQSAGVPTGRIIESNESAASPTNGRFVRYANGTLICRHTLTTGTGGGTTWTYPSAFLAGSVPVVSLTPVGTAAWTALLDAAPGDTSCTVSVRDTAGARVAATVHLLAVGRWSSMT